MASSDTEKQLSAHNETLQERDKVSEAQEEVLNEFSPEEQKRIIRHIDRRLVVTVGFMYCVSLMDRTNLGAANIAGLSKDLQLYLGSRYSIVSLVFFVTYIICQPPSTVIVRKIGPRLHLSLITIFWGAVMIGMGFVKDWGQLVGLRIVLGVFEAGFFPSCVYLLSTWYTRCYWLLVHFPDSTKKNWSFLGDRERAWVVARVMADRGDVRPPPFRMGDYLRSGLDWKVWAYAMIFFNTTTVTYALAYFLPIILVANMGYSTVEAQCLVAPPYAFAGIIMMLCGWLGDRYRVRGPFIVFNSLLCIIGLPIVGFHSKAAVRYFGIFLVTAGANANIPSVMSYQANNIRGQWKRAFASATMVGFGGIGGIAGSLVFRTQDSPGYRPGIYACLATSILNVICVAILSVVFRIENGKADRGEKELETAEEDYQRGFRYTF